ncbi:MAG: hypothetical protein ACP5GJ_03690 [Nanopusillaceae archaeon]|jgi:hypothetical protein
MRKKSGAGAVFLLFILVAIGILFYFYGGRIIQAVEVYMYNPGSSSIIQAGENLFNGFYGSLQAVYNILSNPEQYAEKQLMQTEPANQQVYSYTINLQPLQSLPGLIEKDGNTTQTEVEYEFEYSLPANEIQNNQVEFICNSSYPSLLNGCFIDFPTTSNVQPSSTSISSPFQVQTVVCQIPSFQINTSNCNSILSLGFTIDNNIKAIINDVMSSTKYNFLAVSATIAAYANANNENIYTYLKINPSGYDVGIYNGVYNLPYIEIGRAGKESGYPVLLENNQTAYDVIFISLDSINGIKKINSWTLSFIYDPSQINLEYLNGNQCTNSYSFGNNREYEISCNNNNCNIYVNSDFLKILQNNGQLLILAIPLCMQPGSSFQGYTTVTIISNISYNYLLSSSATINYYTSS